MEEALRGTDIDPSALKRYIEEQIYSLPGTDRHREEFSIILTGSRAVGTHADDSDVDIDVICPQTVYDEVHRASLESGIITSPTSFWRPLREENWERYFGKERGKPHFTLQSLETIKEQFEKHEDVPLWIWTHARPIEDPEGQFREISESFRGYPKDTLIRKIKYHWLLAGYWAIDVFPLHPKPDEDLLAAVSALSNSICSLLRFFFLVECKPFPYTERLMRHAASDTELGRRFSPMLRKCADAIAGHTKLPGNVWSRLESVFDRLHCCDKSEDARRLSEACARAMITAGVERNWVEADYDNIDELLQGRLGVPPV